MIYRAPFESVCVCVRPHRHMGDDVVVCPGAYFVGRVGIVVSALPQAARRCFNLLFQLFVSILCFNSLCFTPVCRIFSRIVPAAPFSWCRCPRFVAFPALFPAAPLLSVVSRMCPFGLPRYLHCCFATFTRRCNCCLASVFFACGIHC